MSAVPQPRSERDLKQRVASLEARIAWLEDTLGQVLGTHGLAANEPNAKPAPLSEQLMLRTQPLPTLAWPLDATVPGTLATIAAPVPVVPVAPVAPAATRGGPADRKPQAPFALELTSTAPLSTLLGTPDKPAPPPPPARDAFSLEAPDSAAIDAFTMETPPMFTMDEIAPTPAPVAAAPAASNTAKPAAAAGGFSLGITAAFSTLESKIAEAADADLAVSLKRGYAAPEIDIMPEMIDLALPRPTRTLEVRSVMERVNPSILQLITDSWEDPDCALRLQRLIAEDHGGRMGIDPGVKEEMLLLCTLRESMDGGAAARLHR